MPFPADTYNERIQGVLTRPDTSEQAMIAGINTSAVESTPSTDPTLGIGSGSSQQQRG